MKDFLNGIFDEGKRTNRKLDARAVAKRMKTAEAKNDRGENVARFLPEEWLNYRQIAGYFSRRKRLQQQGITDTEGNQAAEGDSSADFQVTH